MCNTLCNPSLTALNASRDSHPRITRITLRRKKLNMVQHKKLITVRRNKLKTGQPEKLEVGHGGTFRKTRAISRDPAWAPERQRRRPGSRVLRDGSAPMARRKRVAFNCVPSFQYAEPSPIREPRHKLHIAHVRRYQQHGCKCSRWAVGGQVCFPGAS